MPGHPYNAQTYASTGEREARLRLSIAVGGHGTRESGRVAVDCGGRAIHRKRGGGSYSQARLTIGTAVAYSLARRKAVAVTWGSGLAAACSLALEGRRR